MIKIKEKVLDASVVMHAKTMQGLQDGISILKSKKGQGTTEYAILVGVLVVIAITAVVLFKDKIEDLWNQIATGINGL